MYGILSQIEAYSVIIISQKCMVTPNFLFGYQEY